MLTYTYTVFMSILERARSLSRSDERGASLVEYTFLLVFIVAVAIGSIKYFGGSVTGGLSHSSNAVNNAVPIHN